MKDFSPVRDGRAATKGHALSDGTADTAQHAAATCGGRGRSRSGARRGGCGTAGSRRRGGTLSEQAAEAAATGARGAGAHAAAATTTATRQTMKELAAVGRSGSGGEQQEQRKAAEPGRASSFGTSAATSRLPPQPAWARHERAPYLGSCPGAGGRREPRARAHRGIATIGSLRSPWEGSAFWTAGKPAAAIVDRPAGATSLPWASKRWELPPPPVFSSSARLHSHRVGMSAGTVHRACSAGDQAGLEAALSAHPTLAKSIVDGKTPLHIAPTAAIVRVLVAAGADPLAVDAHGRTPLLVAAESGSLTLITELARVTALGVVQATASGQAPHVAADRLGRSPAHWLGQRLLARVIREAAAAAAAAHADTSSGGGDALTSSLAAISPLDLAATVLGATACTAGGETPLHWSVRAAAAPGAAAHDLAGVVRELGGLGVPAGLRTRDGASASSIVVAALKAGRAVDAGDAAGAAAPDTDAERTAALEAAHAALQALERAQAGRALLAGRAESGGAACPPAAAAPVKVSLAPAALAGGRKQAGSRPKRGRIGGLGRRAAGPSGVQVTLKPAGT